LIAVSGSREVSRSVLAYFLHHFSPFIVEFRQGIGLRWYGLAYVAAFLLGYLLYKWLAERRYTDLPPEQVGDFITWAAVFGVMLGGRLGWVIFYGWRQVLSDPMTALRVWEGGMASHGGILGLVLFTFYWARRHRVSWTSIGDSLCVVAPIGLFIVRLANFINGELYGRPATVPWAMLFPGELYEDPMLQARLGLVGGDQVASFIEAARHQPALADQLRGVLTPRHPSQLYEAALEGVVLFLVLWVLRTRCRVPRGVITGAFFILYAGLRILGEMFREPDPAWSVGSISAGKFLCIFMFAIGAALIVWVLRAKIYERACLRTPET
jgi:phosphatidylglycerol:prolipoprotein diacylglycerol transferase